MAGDGRVEEAFGKVEQAGLLSGSGRQAAVGLPRESGQLDLCSTEQHLLTNMGTQQPHTMAVTGT